MRRTLKIEIEMSQDDIDSFWEDASEAAQEEIGMSIKREEIIKIDADKMAEQELEIYSSMIAGITIGIAITQADKFF